MKDFEKYSNESVHFIRADTADLGMLKGIITEREEIESLADIGCGDGVNLYYLIKDGIISTEKNTIYAVDLSEERLKRVEYLLGGRVNTIHSDAMDINVLPDRCLDFIINNAVIEHLEQPALLLRELHRLLRDNGSLYISSVVKTKCCIYIYRNNGEFVMDPTHVSEFHSFEEFENLLISCGFKVIRSQLNQSAYSILDLFIRLLIKMKLVKPDSMRMIFAKSKLLTALRRVKMPIIGFKSLKVYATKV